MDAPNVHWTKVSAIEAFIYNNILYLFLLTGLTRQDAARRVQGGARPRPRWLVTEGTLAPRGTPAVEGNPAVVT